MNDLIQQIDNADPHEHGDNWNLLMEALDELVRQRDEIERLQAALKRNDTRRFVIKDATHL